MNAPAQAILLPPVSCGVLFGPPTKANAQMNRRMQARASVVGDTAQAEHAEQNSERVRVQVISALFSKSVGECMTCKHHNRIRGRCTANR